MKKNFYKVFSFLFLFLVIGVGNAFAKDLSELPSRTYVIGSYEFAPGEALTTDRIMLASKTISGSTLDDMVIYYKNANNVWVDAAKAGKKIDEAKLPTKFEIEYKVVDSKIVEVEDEVVEPETPMEGIEVSKLNQTHYAVGDILEFTISGFEPNTKVNVGMPINTEAGGWLCACDKLVINGMIEEGEGEDTIRYWEGTTDKNGVLSVSGKVQSNLPNGVLYITLPDYGYNIDKAIELQDENGNSVTVGDSTIGVLTVSAIDKTIKLDVTALEPVEGVKANVEIFKLDKNGEKTTPSILKVTNLEIEEGIVTVDGSAKTFGDADYVIVVKVGDVEEEIEVTIEFKTIEKLVTDINKATAAQLATLLNNEAYFTGFDITKVDAYYAIKGALGTFKTITEIQEDLIVAVEAAAEFDAFVEEIDEISGVFAKYMLLKATFKYVDDANMNEYMASTGSIFNGSLDIDSAMTSFEKVQDEIDQINLDTVVDKFDAKVKAIDGDAKPSKLNAAKTALEGLELANVKTKATVAGATVNIKTKAQIIEAIVTQLEKIDEAWEAVEKTVVKAEAALVAHLEAGGEDDDTDYKNLVEELDKLDEEDLTENAVKAINTALGNGENDSQLIHELVKVTKELTIIADTLVAVDEFKEAFEVNNDTDYKSQTVYTAIFVDTTGSATTPVLDKNATTGEYEFGKDSNGSNTPYTSSDLQPLLIALETATKEWKTYNAAIATTDAAEMRTLLFDLDVASAFLELPSATKTEFAQYVIDELAEEATLPANFTALKTAIFTGGYLTAYEAKITAVNTAGDVSDMIAALKAISEDYKELGTEAQADIASDLFEEVDGGKIFKTIGEIIATMGL